MGGVGEPEFGGTDRFRVRRRIGAGGMGIVYEALDLERRAPVALKTLRTLDELNLTRFKNEFRALADLTHPNLVRLGELYCEHNQWFFTMELVDGETFLSYVRGSRKQPGHAEPDENTAPGALAPTPPTVRAMRPFDEQRLRAALGQLCIGVAALHAAGKIHRDIKPSNILVTKNGRTVLLDFGLVTDAAAGKHSTDIHVVGTVSYMAPEQAAGKRLGPEADWYAVGSVLYEALTGRPPFDGGSIDVMVEKQTREPAPPQSIVQGLPADLSTLCTKLLRIDPSARPTAPDILRQLGVAKPTAALSKPAVAAVPFVGRQHELDLLDAAFGEAEAGRGTIVLVRGESGIGKSALVRRYVDGLAARGALVLSGRCYEREQVPFKAFDGIVDALSRHLAHIDQVTAAFLLPREAALLARIFPILRRIPAMSQAVEPLARVQDPLEVRIRAFAALREMLQRLVERGPLALFIDDLQWADADSIALLGELMHPPGAPALLLLATLRTGTNVDAITRAVGELRQVELSPLSPAEGQELAGLLIGSAADPRVKAIAHEAGGHPLFIQELARHLAGGRSGGPVRLDDALGERIAALDARDHALLDILAIAGAPISQQVASAAAEIELADLIGRVAQLRAQNLVRTGGARGSDLVEPYHDRLREAVLARLGAEDRARLHGRIAVALEMSGAADADPRALVRHFHGAGDVRRAAHYAERAARIAFETLAFEQSAELFRVALSLGAHTDTDPSRLNMQLGDALANSGRGREAADAYLAAVAGADAGLRLEAQRRAAEQLLISGHIDRGLTTLAAVLTDIGVGLPPSRRRALISLLTQRARIRLRGLTWQKRDVSEIVPRDLVRVDVFKAVAMSLALVDNIRGADFQARGLLLALRLGESQRVGRSLALEAIYQSTRGRKASKRVAELIHEVKRVFESTSDPQVHGWVYGASGVSSYLCGEFRQGAELLRECEKIFREQTTGTSFEMASACILRLLALRFMGSFRELRGEFDRYVRDAARRGDRYAETTLTRACNLVWLVEDAPEMALRDLDSKAWTPPQGGYHIQHFYDLRARIEVALYTDTVKEKRAELLAEFGPLKSSMLLRIQTIRCEALWLRARLALAAGDVREAARMARQLEREGAPYADVWANLVRASVERDEAHLRKAQSGAEKLDLWLCAAAAQARLSGTPSAYFAEQGIKNPSRMLALVAPP